MTPEDRDLLEDSAEVSNFEGCCRGMWPDVVLAVKVVMDTTA
jgi:hypothetical protein